MSHTAQQQTGTATFLKRLTGFTGDARAYRLDPPLPVEKWDDSYESQSTVEHQFVIVSAVVAYSGPETYIFAADPETLDIADWLELDGSFRGALDHAQALSNAGYEVSA